MAAPILPSELGGSNQQIQRTDEIAISRNQRTLRAKFGGAAILPSSTAFTGPVGYGWEDVSYGWQWVRAITSEDIGGLRLNAKHNVGVAFSACVAFCVEISGGRMLPAASFAGISGNQVAGNEYEFPYWSQRDRRSSWVSVKITGDKEFYLAAPFGTQVTAILCRQWKRQPAA